MPRRKSARPVPLPLQGRKARENEERQADRLRRARRELRILPFPRPAGPFFQEKTFIGLPFPANRRRKSRPWGRDEGKAASQAPSSPGESRFELPPSPEKRVYRASTTRRSGDPVRFPRKPHAVRPGILGSEPHSQTASLLVTPTVFGRPRRVVFELTQDISSPVDPRSPKVDYCNHPKT